MKIPQPPPNVKENKDPRGLWQAVKQYTSPDSPGGKFVREMNDKYLSWDEFRHHEPLPTDRSPTELWAITQVMRGVTAKYLDIFKDKTLILRYNVSASNILQKKLHELDMKCAGSFQAQSIVPKEDRTTYLLSSLMEEAIASSQLEGAATSRRVAKEMLRSNRKPKNNDERMIYNNYQTMKHIVDLKEKQLTPEMILDIHARITEHTLDQKEWEGKFRTSNEVRVHDKETGEILHSPPPYEKIPELVQKYCDFANSKDHFAYIHPLAKASILRFLIGYLHPFEDGNGRTARSIFYWYLLSQGYWLLQFMAGSRFI